MNLGKQLQVGAEWAKWDLHVHTPSSIIQNFKALDGNDVWESYIRDLESLPESVKVLGINDYQFLDGYIKVLEYKNNGRLKNIDLLLPVLEFRIKKFAGHREFKRLNLHVIFSNELTTEIIQEQFLNTLTAEYQLSTEFSESDSDRWSGVITRKSLEDLGNKIKSSIPEDKLSNYGSDLEEGFNNINIDDDIIRQKLSKSSYFEGKYLTAIGKTEWDSFSWSDSSIAEKKHVINTSNFVFTAAETPDNFYRAKEKLSSQKVNSLLLDCSDAHHNSQSANKDRIGNCFTWIKADRTFNGLKQVIHDKERVFIGDIPPVKERELQNPTKFIEELSFSKKEGVFENEIWFNNLTIPLNSSLVAIIGNKGQGKSALADTIGLLGNSKSFNDFSFIRPDRFKKKKPYDLSAIFEAKLKWKSGFVVKKHLSEEFDPAMPETVKYIPQGFLEKLCNEDVGLFEIELKKVIFNHLPNEQKLGYGSLDDLINSKTEVLKSQILDIQNDIDLTNNEIANLEFKLQPEEIKKIEEYLKNKKNSLALHQSNKPALVSPPSDESIVERNRTISDLIQIKRLEVNSLDIQISDIRQTISDLTKHIKSSDSILGQVELLSKRISDTKENLSDDLLNINMNWDELIRVDIDTEKLKKYRSEYVVKLNKESEKLKDSIPDSLVSVKKDTEKEIVELQLQLDTPSREYQNYLTVFDNWEKQLKLIIGNSQIADTLEYYQHQLDYINSDISDDLNNLKTKRKDSLEKLFEIKYLILEIYKSVFEPLTEFIKSYNDILQNHEISLDVTFRIESFVEKFFDKLNLGVKGSFYGSLSGPEKLKLIIDNYNFSTKLDVIEFVEEIVKNLTTDCRDGQNNEKRFVIQQLKKGYTVSDLYNHIFHLDYLIPEYKLRLGGKSISELSPGERGALLLIFYLTLDKDDVPLIIDQPEENLDNQSVFNILVQFITKAKSRRQIIIVTHNPNLAVVCDAEQIIHVEMDKLNGNRMIVNSGAIENNKIKKAVVDILEGTFPAFDKRSWKYKASN